MIHVAVSKHVDLAGISEAASCGESPGHVLNDLAQRMKLEVHPPVSEEACTRADRMRARIYGLPRHWATARYLAETLTPGDVIFATGEDVGLPMAATFGYERLRPRLVVFAHNVDRPRARLAAQLFRCKANVDLWLTNAKPQFEYLVRTFGPDRVRMVPEQTDTRFFRPGRGAKEGTRPLIAAVGLERRDYRTLAEATARLEVDVAISAFSRDATVIRELFPPQLPANMTCRFYAWPELLQLYRSADLVVVPLVENRFCAGLTAVLEALACQRPVIVSRTSGLASLCEEGVTYAVPAQHAAGLPTGIQHMLENPHVAQELAARGYEWVQRGHTPRHWVNSIVDALTSLSPGPKQLTAV